MKECFVTIANSECVLSFGQIYNWYYRRLGPVVYMIIKRRVNFIYFNMFKDLNEKWSSLQQLTQERATQLGSAHEVQRFHRDVDETKDWIQEKDEALNNDDLGKDLRTVQALQRKHEGLERDLAALGDKVSFFIDLSILYI